MRDKKYFLILVLLFVAGCEEPPKDNIAEEVSELQKIVRGDTDCFMHCDGGLKTRVEVLEIQVDRLSKINGALLENLKLEFVTEPERTVLRKKEKK